MVLYKLAHVINQHKFPKVLGCEGTMKQVDKIVILTAQTLQ